MDENVVNEARPRAHRNQKKIVSSMPNSNLNHFAMCTIDTSKFNQGNDNTPEIGQYR